MLIDGRAMAGALLGDTIDKLDQLRARGIEPALAVILVGGDPASEVYVGRKIAECHKAGIRSIQHRFASDLAEATLLTLIDDLNADPAIHGILVQLALPHAIAAGKVLDRISPMKDVDGFHRSTSGACRSAQPGLSPGRHSG
jgi:methylenetetrahydrofolate dehydrogenase (NADP+)/methenyltetrahydrofolate cyclohydrolase